MNTDVVLAEFTHTINLSSYHMFLEGFKCYPFIDELIHSHEGVNCSIFILLPFPEAESAVKFIEMNLTSSLREECSQMVDVILSILTHLSKGKLLD